MASRLHAKLACTNLAANVSAVNFFKIWSSDIFTMVRYLFFSTAVKAVVVVAKLLKLGI